MYALRMIKSDLEKLELTALTENLDELEYITRYQNIDSIYHYHILKKAILSGKIEAPKLLIHRRCRVIRDKEAYSGQNELLHLAISTGNFELVPLLIKQNVSPHCPDQNNIPPLFNFIDMCPNDMECSQILDSFLENNDRCYSRIGLHNYTILHHAAEKGKDKIITLLLERKWKINDQAKDGSTALHVAAKYGHSKVVKVLLNNGAEDSVFNSDKMTPLCLAIENGDFHTFEILFESFCRSEALKKPKLKNFGIQDFTLLHLACLNGSFPKTFALLNTNKFDLNAKSNTGLTALHLAMKAGNSETVSLLLNKGADYKVVDENKKTPLSFALECTNGDAKTLEMLLSHIHRAENDKNDLFFTPENQLLLEYHSRAREDETGNSVLHLAVQKEDEVAVCLFLKHEACIDALNQDGHTPLDLATINGSLFIINIFLDSQNNPQTLFVPKQIDGTTPMHFAVEKENNDIMEIFFKAGISADISKPNALSPLHIAVLKNNTDLVTMLLKNGAKIDVCGRDKYETPLFTAAEAGNTNVFEILLEASTVEFSKWKKGYFAMYIAAYNGHEEIVKLLLDKGVDPNANFSDYLTPLHAAAQKGHLNIVKLLLKYKAHVDRESTGSRCFISSPLLAASHAGQSEIIQLLLEHGADSNVHLVLFSSFSLRYNMCPKGNKDGYSSEDSTYTISSNAWRRRDSSNYSYYSDSSGYFYEVIKPPPLFRYEKVLKRGSYKDSEIGEGGSLLEYNSLHFAVEAEDEETVKLLIKNGVNINYKTVRGVTAIGLAIENENEAIIQHLFSAGVNIRTHHKSESIFKIQSLKKNVKIVEMLLEYVCSSQNYFGPKAYFKSLRIAIRNEHETCVLKLLDTHSDVILKQKDLTILIDAIIGSSLVNKYTFLQILLKNACEKTLYSALSTATSRKEVNAIQLLLDKGADPYFSKSNYTLLHRAVLEKNVTIVEMLLRKTRVDSTDWHSAYHHAIEHCNNLQIIQMFIDFGASIHLRDKKVELPLFQAVGSYSIDKAKVVRFLLKKGAFLNDTTDGEKKLLDSFFKFDCKLYHSMSEIFQIFIDLDTFSDDQNAKDYSPLETLLNNEKKSLHDTKFRNFFLKLSLFNGANANYLKRHSGDESLLHLGIKNEDTDSVKVLLLNGVDLSILNGSKKSPLEMAINIAFEKCKPRENYSSRVRDPSINKELDNFSYDEHVIIIDGIHHSKSEPRILHCRKIVRLLVQEVARRMLINKDMEQETLTLMHSEYVKKYYERCQSEINLMQVTEICPGITYFDVLVANYTKLVTLCRSKDVRLLLIPGSKVTKLFPEYSELLIERIEIRSDRRLLLNSSYRSLEKVLQCEFPHLIVEHVYSFLLNRDLKNLNKACNNDLYSK